MKARRKKKGVFVLFLTAAYLAGIALGIALFGLFPIYIQQKPRYLSIARLIGQEYLQGKEEEFQKVSSPYSQILIYDAEGKCVRSKIGDGIGTLDALEAYAGRWLSNVLEGEEIFAVTESVFSPGQLHFWITTGASIKENNMVVGAVFLIWNLQNVQETVITYSVTFTVIYWISVYLILSYSRKKRKLDELKQNYIANVTHAFKTPIASIHAMAEALCDGTVPDPDRQQDFFGLILQETNRQSRMVQEMLDLARLQSDGVDLTKSAVRAEEIFAPIAERYAVLCDCTDVTLHVAAAVFSLPPLYTNAACIRQVLELLLDNAIKFVPEGGDVWIEAKTAGNRAVICVRDNGIGIAGADLPHIFERFYRCDRSDAAGGSGLGLAIAKETVDGLKEKLWAESEEGRGTTFYFTIRIK